MTAIGESCRSILGCGQIIAERPPYTCVWRIFVCRHDVVLNLEERVENGTLDWERAMNRFYETTRRIDELGVFQSQHQ